jgi:hypothetical protein
MPINYFIYDDVIDSFIEFEMNEENLYYYLCLQYYNELNNIEYMNKFNSNTKKRNTYVQNTYKYNIKNKRFKK